ncbi:MAG TPA: hypothetical protein VEJ67_00850 [Candidatus Cybelea sp.]|nr:hypothetical protein [Candidatus Cybelea sp.]
MRFSVVAAAMLLAASAAPLLVHAQASDSSDTIILVTGESKVRLQTSPNDSCTATTSGGHALAIAIGGRCSSFATSADIPASLYVKITPDKITFREGGRSYVLTDAVTIARAREPFASVREMMQKQSGLGHEMSALGVRERDASLAYKPARVSVPDLSAAFQKVEADAKRLSAEGATESELSALQSEISELQSRISEAESQASEAESGLSDQRSQLSDHQMRTMSEEMNEMSQQMKAWSGQGEEAAEQAARRVKALLDQAITDGIAKQE